MLTITEVIGHAQSIFVEAYNAQGDTRLVRRNPELLTSPEGIYEAFITELGDRLFSCVVEDASTGSSPITLEQGSIESSLAAIRTMFEYFRFRGYCVAMPNVSFDNARKRISTDIPAPAVLWSSKYLATRNAVRNAYDEYAILSCLRSHGIAVTEEPVTKVSETGISRTYGLA